MTAEAFAGVVIAAILAFTVTVVLLEECFFL